MASTMHTSRGFDRRIFRSRVARRMFIIFVLCALLPVSGFALYSFARVSRQLEHDAREQLRAESKITGMAILERLTLVDAMFRTYGSLEEAADPRRLRGGAIRNLFAAPGPDVPEGLRRHLGALLPNDDRERNHVRAGNALLRVIPGDDGDTRLYFVRQRRSSPGQEARAQGASKYWICEIDREHLWSPETLRIGTHLAVRDADAQTLFATAFETSAIGVGETAGVVDIGDEPFLWESWELFLGAGYLAPPWTLFQLRREADVLAPVREFRSAFPLVAMLAVWIAALLSSAQIRRHLVPIDRLRAATQRFATRDFDVRVQIDTDDEFRDLGDAFNDMAMRVGDLTRNLEAKVAQRTSELAAALDELRETQAQLVHREKMASIGQFVAGIAHEINNPLAFIGGNLHFLRKYTADLTATLGSLREEAARDGGTLHDQLESIWRERDLDHVLSDLEAVFDGCAEGVQRTTTLVQDLKTFSRVDEGECLPVDLTEAIDATLNLMRGRLDGIEIVREFSELPPVECLAGQINQVLMNLLVNAGDAVNDEGRIVVRAFPVGGDRVAVEVEDDGCGMPPEVAEHVFDPFYTTKEVGEGTGLGLSVSYGIVQRHAGRIEVYSQPDRGTRFRVELPVHFQASGANDLMPNAETNDEPL